MYCGDTVQRKEGSCVNESQEWKKRAHVQEERVNDEQTENLKAWKETKGGQNPTG